VTRRFEACQEQLEKCKDRQYLCKMRAHHRAPFRNVEHLPWFQRMVAQQAVASVAEVCLADDCDDTLDHTALLLSSFPHTTTAD
jgi:hypothetical protein